MKWVEGNKIVVNIHDFGGRNGSLGTASLWEMDGETR